MCPAVSVLGLFLLTALTSSTNGEDALKSLAETTQINRRLLERLPMYTCLETIIRQEKTAKQRKAQTLDTVQVDVGIGANDEIYSWPGETAFSSGGLEQLVGQGLVGSGFFAVDSKNLFLGNAAIVKPAEEQNTPGKGPTHFSYRIPSLMNHWLVNWLGIRAVVGESGEFWTTKIREPYVGLERSLKTYRLSCH